VKAVVMHEAALKAQAKKMNVESLRSGDQSGESVEVKIAKVNKSRRQSNGSNGKRHCKRYLSRIANGLGLRLGKVYSVFTSKVST
jgi:hypothetical protein